MNQPAFASSRMTNYRWTVCILLFVATAINYLDRQVLSLTWKDFIAPEFHWTNSHYGRVASLFSIFYALSMLFAGRFIDWIGTKKGFMWAIGVWSVGAVIHAFCGIATSGVVTGEWFVGFEGARHNIGQYIEAGGRIGLVATTSMVLFIFARFVLAVGEAGNFPAAIKSIAEYFPKKDRAFSTSIFNAGATVGALVAPLSIPPLALAFGWEAAFIIIGALGFVWMGAWLFMYYKPGENRRVNAAELAYIHQDEVGGVAGVCGAPLGRDFSHSEIPGSRGLDPGLTSGTPLACKAASSSLHGFPAAGAGGVADADGAGGVAGVALDDNKVSFLKCLSYRQAWAFAVGRFMSDGVWWFFLFWTPAYLSSIYGLKSSDLGSKIAISTLYAITLLSIIGGWLPGYFMEKKGMNPYAGRMRAMLIIAFFPLLVLVAHPLGVYSYWFPIVIIGIVGAAHQAWAANIFSTVGDMFPKKAIATITGFGGMAGGVGSFLINIGSGYFFDYAKVSDLAFLGFRGESAGYMIVFSLCAFAYLSGWRVMMTLVPKYKPIAGL